MIGGGCGLKNSDRLKRAVAFYFSVILYFTLLPIVLSYSLGYKIDFRALKIYKTGIIYIKSTPAGAEIYLNDRRHNDLTPAQIEELKPGTYKIEVRQKGFYAWENDVTVRPNMVTKADRIILFPIIQQAKLISDREISDFAISEKNYIYFMDKAGLFKSNMDGTALKRLSLYSNWPGDITARKFSIDGSKFLYFNQRTVWLVSLNAVKAMAQVGEYAEVEEIVTADEPILDVFWYSGSGYIIVVTERYINVVELRGGARRNAAALYKFNSKPQRLYYDSINDSLYFIDRGKGPDSRLGNYLYRLDLRQTFFDKLMNMLLKREAEVRL